MASYREFDEPACKPPTLAFFLLALTLAFIFDQNGLSAFEIASSLTFHSSAPC